MLPICSMLKNNIEEFHLLLEQRRPGEQWQHCQTYWDYSIQILQGVLSISEMNLVKATISIWQGNGDISHQIVKLSYWFFFIFQSRSYKFDFARTSTKIDKTPGQWSGQKQMEVGYNPDGSQWYLHKYLQHHQHSVSEYSWQDWIWCQSWVTEIVTLFN